MSAVTAEDQLQRWLAVALPGEHGLNLLPLPVEASTRTFFRVCSARAPSGTGHVVMVSPPELEQNAQFEALARLFGRHDLPVPAIVASDTPRGWYLLTDLGSTDLEHAYQGPERDAALRAAIVALVRLQRISDPVVPPYEAERFVTELGIFEEWFVERAAGVELPADVARAFTALVERTQNQQQCCVHRDYHCRNLLYSGGRLGIVDFQDALIGPVSYDLASLVHDCYHEFPRDEAQRWIDFYLDRSSFTLDPATFSADVEFSAVQRQLKAVGIFARLKLRDGKSSHLRYIPSVLARTRTLASRHPVLAPLAGWLQTLDVAAALARLDTQPPR